MKRKNSWSSKSTTRRSSSQPVLIFLVSVALFLCGIQLFSSGNSSPINLPPPYNPQYVRCKSMNLSKERLEAPYQLEGIHYPNQTYYMQLVESDPDLLVIRAPLIHNKSQIIIVVGSKNYEPEARIQIRRSWANKLNPYLANHTISVIFTVGNNPGDRKCLQREADHFNDLLIVDAMDSYRGLVYKMLVAYRYLDAHYKNMHVVKVSKDTVVDINQFMQFMDKLNSTPALYGYIFWSSAPQREPGGQWYVPKDVFPDENFPPYAIGNLYIMTKTAFPLIMRKDLLQKAKVIELEDVFLTGIMPKAANVTVHWLQDFSLPSVDTNKCPTEAEKKLFATTVPDRNIEHRYNDFMDFKERACTGG